MFKARAFQLKVLFLFLFLLYGPGIAPADQQQREAMFYKYLEFPDLIKGGVITPHWMADGNRFWFVAGTPENRLMFKVDCPGNTKSPLFDVSRLRKTLAAKLGYMPGGKGVPFGTFSYLDNETKIQFTVDQKRFLLNLDSYKIAADPPHSDLYVLEEWKKPKLIRVAEFTEETPYYEIPSPNGKWMLFDKDSNLWIRSTDDNQSTRITEDGVKRYGWDFVGAKWSPDGLKIAAVKSDSRHCAYSPIVHWLGHKERIEWWLYADPGDALPQNELYIVNALKRSKIRVDLGDMPDQQFYILGWRSDGSEVLIGRQDRYYKKLDLLAGDPETGKTRTILTESQNTFVEYKGFHIFKDGTKFLWLSERDGWAHIYLYDINGTLIKQLTKGQFPVMQIVAIDEDEGWVYFTAHAEERVYDTHLYRISLEGKGFARLTEGEGKHRIRMSPSLKYFVDTYSSVTKPPSSELRSAGGKLLQELARANIDAVKALKRIKPEEFTVKAADGKTDLCGVMYKPWDFDPNKKYPVIDHLYGGPQTTWGPRTYDLGHYGVLAQAIAQLGFIVFTVDARGTPERSKAFQDVVYGQLGRNEIPDHVATLKQLAERHSFIDSSRVGVYGSSWGGYFTLRAMLLYPDVYHAGVAGAPVSDVTQYIGHEKYIGPLEKNCPAYEYGSNSKIAHRLKGHLLIPIGTSDKNVRFAFPMVMAEALIRANKFFDMMILPQRDHHYGYRGGERPWHKRRYFGELIRRHFQKYLLQEKPMDH